MEKDKAGTGGESLYAKRFTGKPAGIMACSLEGVPRALDGDGQNLKLGRREFDDTVMLAEESGFHVLA